MSDIFISYAKEDKEKAGLLAKVFEQQGWTVWWDPKIPSGKSWPDVIEEALSITKCVVALWSKTSRESKWVKKEARYADQRSILIPVLIENVEVPFEFDHLQAALLFDWKGQEPTAEIDKLIEDVEAVPGIPQKNQSEIEKIDTKKEEVSRLDAIKGNVVDKKDNVKKTPEKEGDRKVENIEKRGSGEEKDHDSKKQQDTTTLDSTKRSSILPWLLPSIIVPFIIGMVVLVMTYMGQDSLVGRGGLPGSTSVVGEAETQNEIYQNTGGELSLNGEHTDKEEVRNSVIPKATYLSVESVKAMLKNKGFHDKDWNTSASGFSNDYKLQNNGKVVFDRASELMWEQSGSDGYISYDEAKKYVVQLNSNKFAGYSDWRLPTLEEAMSLMEPEKKNGSLYIDPIFDKRQQWIWTSDLQSASGAWVVDFLYGYCSSDSFDDDYYVRAVR